jgi:chromosome segregation ATPase
MQVKRFVVLSAMVSTLTLGAASAAFADNATPTPSNRQTEALGDVRARIDHRIDTRLNLLNKLVQRLNSDTKLNANDKALLLNEDQAAITGLTTLKAKIDADTTAADVNTDVQQVSTYKVFEILAPQTRELVAVDDLESTAAKIGTSITDLQNKLNAIQGQGGNVTAIQALLTDASNNLQAINTTLANDQSQLEAITPTSTNTSATFQSIRKDLSTVRSEFAAIKSDFSKIKDAVSALHPTVTPTPTP